MNPQRLHERFADSVRMNAMLDPRTHAAKTQVCCRLAQGVALSVERMISSSHGLALRVNTWTPLRLDRCRRSKGRTRKPTAAFLAIFYRLAKSGDKRARMK